MKRLRSLVRPVLTGVLAATALVAAGLTSAPDACGGVSPPPYAYTKIVVQYAG